MDVRVIHEAQGQPWLAYLKTNQKQCFLPNRRTEMIGEWIKWSQLAPI